jgi:hypothetical protein
MITPEKSASGPIQILLLGLEKSHSQLIIIFLKTPRRALVVVSGAVMATQKKVGGGRHNRNLQGCWGLKGFLSLANVKFSNTFPRQNKQLLKPRSRMRIGEIPSEIPFYGTNM